MEDSDRIGLGAARARRWGAAARIGIAPEGLSITFAMVAAAVLAWLLGLSWLALALGLLALAVAGFFRDPQRAAPQTAGIVLSGADGRVTDIGEGSPPAMPQLRCRRVSVFMSPLDVHVNRAPVSGEVEAIRHAPGEFRAAFSDWAGEHNERNSIVVRDGEGREHVVVQIAGYLARRIVCRVQPREHLERGQRIGLIMFGSRVDHFIPLDFRITVKRGDRVRAGLSVIGEIQQ